MKSNTNYPSALILSEDLIHIKLIRPFHDKDIDTTPKAESFLEELTNCIFRNFL